ncbi:hypothetical protein FD15_GL000917 [Liquorilactobacillus sucicola DSM 21376 = JCM 15457]|uniref:Uncharacterized protein n=2 Tax=Liquorilactobacillus sucicola TaxID=519050 RepID=A0A0R2E4J1_9LACO|nr:hypothetical protein FD15_GL000917 [Liquorilactobacillus sucicola DSM 21376 = JCM 15457]
MKENKKMALNNLIIKTSLGKATKFIKSIVKYISENPEVKDAIESVLIDFYKTIAKNRRNIIH